MVDETNTEKTSDSSATGLKDLLRIKAEPLEPYRYGEVADKFKHTASGYTAVNTDDFNIFEIIEAFKGNKKVIVPVLSDFTANVLVEPISDDLNKTSFTVEDDTKVYTFLRLEKQKGFLEFVSSGIKVKHDQDAEGNFHVSSQYWSCTVRGVFRPFSETEEKNSSADSYEFLHITHKGDRGIVIDIYDPFADNFDRKRENK